MKTLILTGLTLLVLPYLHFAGTIPVGSGHRVKSIQQALAVAEAYDTIIIDQGVYNETKLEVQRPLVIIGNNNAVVDGNGQGQIFIVKSNEVTIRGLTIQNTGYSAMNDISGIHLMNVRRAVIEDNTLINTCYGIYSSESSLCTIRNNFLKGDPQKQQLSGNGIHCWHNAENTIEGNEISGHRDGIYFEFVNQSLIQSNNSHDNLRYGLHFMFSHDNRYIQNIFSRNGSGVAVMYSHQVTMVNNIFSGNWGGSAYGLLLKEITNSQILFNHFETNTTGIHMEGSGRCVFLHNDFSGNGWAVRIQASCTDNLFCLNNFTGNTFDIATNGSLVLNHFKNNYWDKYAGYDLNKDKIGDVSHRPVSLFGVLSERVPEASVLLKSFVVTLLDNMEKVLPSVIPEDLVDEFPIMKKIDHAYPDR